MVNQSVKPEHRDLQLLHICGRCKTLHLATPEGDLRKPTALEMFQIQMQCGTEIRAIDQTDFSHATTAGTVIIPEGLRVVPQQPTPEELQQGEVVFRCMVNGLGEDAMRKLQTMLNAGAPDALLLDGEDADGKTPSAEQKALLRLCYAYMRQARPLEPMPVGKAGSRG